MEIKITTFKNPFSFFVKAEKEADDDINFLDTKGNADGVRMSMSKNDVSDFNHGQYVAVMWKDRWVRGIVSMENQFLIWLVDYGVFLRPNEKSVFIDLPAEYRKYPTKVFEASIHGVCPVDKTFSEDCQIINKVTTVWTNGAVEKARELICSAIRMYFVPVAVLANKYNDIVVGDLYLQIAEKGVVNIVDELEMWPVFLEKNPETYIQNISISYTTRRIHRASLLKPEFPDLDYTIPTVSMGLSFKEYSSIHANTPPFEPALEYGSHSEGGSTVVTRLRRNSDEEYKLTPDEIEKYSRMFVTVYDREYNVLSVLLSKLRDLRMCERYKDHDLKRVGRANSRRLSSFDHDDIDV